ncbi:MAG: helix-turn-helix domain-containing protein [Bacteroidaceae bacterium]|nr:helix-turn-helix domain-containing protein [Bacteroidaceae bacterium]
MKKKEPTQREMILDHLKKFGGITQLTALREYGIMRLASRISDLRKEGHSITKTMLTSTSRITGKPVHYAQYTLG